MRATSAKTITFTSIFLIALGGLIYLVSTRPERVANTANTSNKIAINWDKKQLQIPKKIQKPVNKVSNINQAVVIITDKETGSGSGVIIHPSGYVLTAGHVVSTLEKDEIVLVFDGGKETRKVELVGYDECADLALLKISEWKQETFAYVNIATAIPQLNDPITVFGYPKSTQDMTLAPGVVSKSADDTISTETGIKYPIKINEMLGAGSSGGPIVNKSNQVVGISTVVTPPEFQGGPGLKDIESSLNNMLTRNFNFLGINLYYGNNELEGVGVEGVLAGSPAKKFGLQPGDIITSINNEEVSSSANKTYCRSVEEYNTTKQPISMKVLRENQTLKGVFPNKPLEVSKDSPTNKGNDSIDEELDDLIESEENSDFKQ